MRAAIAAGLGSLAWLAGRERDRWQALLVGAAVLLGWNPYSLFDAGFQLSFAAVASIFVVTPRVVRALEGYPVPHELAQLIGVSTACGLATAPVTWFQFHQISLVTVPANVVAVPVVVEVLGLALLTAVVAPVAPSVAAAMAQVNGWGASLVADCARAFASIPGAQVTSPRAAAVLGLGAAALAAYAWQRGERARVEAGLPPDGDATGRRSRSRSSDCEGGSVRKQPSTSTPERQRRRTRSPPAMPSASSAGITRLVVVDGVEAWKTADVKELESYLASPAPTTVLALVGDGIKKDAALAKAVAKAGQVLAYDVAKKQLPEWVGEQFARLGASADRDACRALVEAVGDDVGDLASEIQKLATWANGETITRATVEELAVGRAETPIFAVTDSWGRRDVAATLRATESLLDRSPRPRSGELIRLVASLVGHIGRVRKASRLADEGVRSSEIASRLKIHPFVAEKSAKQAANFSPDELARATVLLAELDAGAKGGSRLPAELQLERTLVEITRRAE